MRQATPTPTPPIPNGVALLGLTSKFDNSPGADAGPGFWLIYRLYNDTGATQQVEFGATAYSQADGKHYDDPQDDKTLTVARGRGTYNRYFLFPSDVVGEGFDILASVVAPGFTHTYDMRKYFSVVQLPAAYAEPTPTDTPVAPLLDQQGTGSTTTDYFSTDSTDWNVSYGFNCSGTFGGTGNFSVEVYDSSNNLVGLVANVVQATGQGGSYVHQAGQFYLQIDSECAWHVTVSE